MAEQACGVFKVRRIPKAAVERVVGPSSLRKRRWENVDPVRSRTMSAVRQNGTKLELEVGKELRLMGYRFCVSERDLPGTPDIVFKRRKAVIFVHGCYWHGHHCKHGKRQSQTNKDYWVEKIKRNRIRDRQTVYALKKMGWRALVVWECHLQNRELLRDKMRELLAVD
jgi:DNA mismatch endonuclease (patch repair protein)